MKEIGVTFDADLPQSFDTIDDIITDEGFTMALVYASRMKSETKNLIQRCQVLEISQGESFKKLDESERELANLRLTITQHEAKIKALQENIKVAPSYLGRFISILLTASDHCRKWRRKHVNWRKRSIL